MKEAGFVNVREMDYCASQIRGIEHIELPDRVLNGQGICVEGAKRI
jgi:hypothetical protein